MGEPRRARGGLGPPASTAPLDGNKLCNKYTYDDQHQYYEFFTVDDHERSLGRNPWAASGFKVHV